MTRSKLIDGLGRENAALVAAMPPSERLRLAFELGRRGVELYMSAYHADFDTAARILKREGRAGRRYSRCMDDQTS